MRSQQKVRAAQKDLDLLKAEQIAIKTAALAEYSMLDSVQESVRISDDDCTLLKGNVDLLSDQIRDRGLELLKIDEVHVGNSYSSYFVEVKRAVKNQKE